jgi:hypothetical protein
MKVICGPGRQGRGRIAGIASGLVLATGVAFFAVVPGGGTTSTNSILDYYHSSGKRDTAIILALVLVAGCRGLAAARGPASVACRDQHGGRGAPARVGHRYACTPAPDLAPCSRGSRPTERSCRPGDAEQRDVGLTLVPGVASSAAMPGQRPETPASPAPGAGRVTLAWQGWWLAGWVVG